MRILIALILSLLALPAPAEDAPAGCKLVQIANWHVRFLDKHPVLDGYVNGKKIGVLIDTGAYVSLLTKSAAERLGLQTRETGERMVGVGSEVTRVLQARLEDVRIGDFEAKELRVRVAGEHPFAGMDFVLGQDFLQNVDIEFDYANGMVRLFKPIDCKDRNLAYWDANAQQLPLSGDHHDIIPVTVNGE